MLESPSYVILKHVTRVFAHSTLPHPHQLRGAQRGANAAVVVTISLT
jgi:hypothetical protein